GVLQDAPAVVQNDCRLRLAGRQAQAHGDFTASQPRVAHEGREITKQRRNRPGFSTATTDDAIELVNPAAGRLLPLGELAVKLKLGRLQGLSENTEQQSTPAGPRIPRDGIAKERRLF